MADIHKVYLSSLLLAYLFQFQNAALLSSPLLSLLIGSVLARYFQVTSSSQRSSVTTLDKLLKVHMICSPQLSRWSGFCGDL